MGSGWLGSWKIYEGARRRNQRRPPRFSPSYAGEKWIMAGRANERMAYEAAAIKARVARSLRESKHGHQHRPAPSPERGRVGWVGVSFGWTPTRCAGRPPPFGGR